MEEVSNKACKKKRKKRKTTQAVKTLPISIKEKVRLDFIAVSAERGQLS